MQLISTNPGIFTDPNPGSFLPIALLAFTLIGVFAAGVCAYMSWLDPGFGGQPERSFADKRILSQSVAILIAAPILGLGAGAVVDLSTSAGAKHTYLQAVSQWVADEHDVTVEFPIGVFSDPFSDDQQHYDATRDGESIVIGVAVDGDDLVVLDESRMPIERD